MKIFGYEPAVIIGGIATILGLLVNFGVIPIEMSEQIQAVAAAVVTFIGFLLVRQSVVSVKKIDDVEGSGTAANIAASDTTNGSGGASNADASKNSTAASPN